MNKQQERSGITWRMGSQWSISFFIFIVMFFIFLLNMKTSFTTDAIPNFLMINSLRAQGDLTLDEYRDELIIRGIPGVVVGTSDNHLIAKTPPFAAITAYPFFIIIDDIIRSVYDVHPGAISEYFQYVGKITASLFVSIAGVAMFLLLSKMLGNRILAIFGAAIFIFGTPLYSIDGQALWQHPMSVLLITVSLLLLYSSLYGTGHTRRTQIAFIGLLLGASVGVRFNNIIPFAIVGLFITLRFRGLIAYFVLGALPTVVFNMYYNQKYLHNVFAIGYGDPSKVATFMDASPIRAFFGLFFSTNFGLFVFYPILILTVVGFTLFIANRKERRDTSFYYLLIAVLVCNIAFISTYRWYTGGYSWPSRMLSETIPFMFLFIVPVMERLAKKPLPLLFAVVPLFTITLFLNFLGAYANDYSYHEKYYTTIDGWIWDKNKSFLAHYLRKGDLYFTRFEKGKSGQLRIRTKKYNVYTRKSTTTDEPMRTIDTCSKYDSFEKNAFNLSDKLVTLSRTTTSIEVAPNFSIDGVNRSVAMLAENSRSGEIRYSGTINGTTDMLLLSLDGKSTNQQGSMGIDILRNGIRSHSEDEIRLDFGDTKIIPIDLQFETGDSIDIVIHEYSDSPDKRPLIDSIGLCMAFESF